MTAKQLRLLRDFAARFPTSPPKSVTERQIIADAVTDLLNELELRARCDA